MRTTPAFNLHLSPPSRMPVATAWRDRRTQVDLARRTLPCRTVLVREIACDASQSYDFAMASIVPTWVPELFDELNTRYFDGKLPQLTFHTNPLGGRYAAYAPIANIVFFHPRTLDQGKKFVTDSLLHEMVHHLLQQRDGDNGQDHGLKFVEIANRIGRELGVPDVPPSSEAAIEWPQSVRPHGFHIWTAR